MPRYRAGGSPCGTFEGREWRDRRDARDVCESSVGAAVDPRNCAAWRKKTPVWKAHGPLLQPRSFAPPSAVAPTRARTSVVPARPIRTAAGVPQRSRGFFRCPVAFKSMLRTDCCKFGFGSGLSIRRVSPQCLPRSPVFSKLDLLVPGFCRSRIGPRRFRKLPAVAPLHGVGRTELTGLFAIRE